MEFRLRNKEIINQKITNRSDVRLERQNNEFTFILYVYVNVCVCDIHVLYTQELTHTHTQINPCFETIKCAQSIS